MIYKAPAISSIILVLASCVTLTAQESCIKSIDDEISDLKEERVMVQRILEQGYIGASREWGLDGDYRCLQGPNGSIYVLGDATAYAERSHRVSFQDEVNGAACDNAEYIAGVIWKSFVNYRELNLSTITIRSLHCSPSSEERHCGFSGNVTIEEQASINVGEYQETLRFLDTEIPILERSAEQKKAVCGDL
jgi:hypothetical protein